MIRLLFLLVFLPALCSAQLIFEVNSPPEESGVFPCMAGEGSVWTNSPDLYQDGNWFSDTLILSDDGILGSACSALNNSITSNFALFHRSGCDLGQSLLNAQNAGATGAIVIDSVDGRPLPFLGDGLSASITIPFIIIPRGKGDSLIQRIAENQDVVVSFGEKNGVNTTDVGIYKEFSLWSRYGIFPFLNYRLPDDHFGTWVYNHGTTDVTNVQVKLWFYHNISYPEHNQDSLSLPFDLTAGDSVFINFDFEYNHGGNGSTIYKDDPLNYGYELIGITDDDTLDNKISSIIYGEEKLISNSYSPSVFNSDFSEVDYFIEGTAASYDSIGHCLYMPIKIYPQNPSSAYLCNPIVPMANGDPGAEEALFVRKVIIGNQQVTFEDYYGSGFYYLDASPDSNYCNFDQGGQFGGIPVTQNTDIVVTLQTSSSTDLGFSSDMYHDEQIRQGYLPTYFRKNLASSTTDYYAQYILTPIVSFDMWIYPNCFVWNVEEIEHQQVAIFPNPASNLLSIKSENSIESISIFDLFGKQVASNEENHTFETSIDIENLNAGCYLLEVTGENSQKNIIRFIKE